MTLFWILIAICFCGAGLAADSCEPGFADSCFSAVEGDLKYMLHLPARLASNLTAPAIQELCLAIEDALNCTSDVIDTDCSTSDGRDYFDSWLKALRAAYHYVCDPHSNRMKDILQKIQCWDVDIFLRCTKFRANLEHVRDLLHIDFTQVECMDLQMAFADCYTEANVGSCREQEDIQEEFEGLTNAFFGSSACREVLLINDKSGTTRRRPFSWVLHLYASVYLILDLMYQLAANLPVVRRFL